MDCPYKKYYLSIYLSRILEEHNHGVDQVALWLTRCKDSIRMKMEADPNNSKMRAAYDQCINEILNQIGM